MNAIATDAETPDAHTAARLQLKSAMIGLVKLGGSVDLSALISLASHAPTAAEVRRADKVVGGRRVGVDRPIAATRGAIRTIW
jgi:hypothetical protein